MGGIGPALDSVHASWIRKKETFQQRTLWKLRPSSRSPELPIPTSEGTLLFTAAKASLKSSSLRWWFCLDVGYTPFQALWSPNHLSVMDDTTMNLHLNVES